MHKPNLNVLHSCASAVWFCLNFGEKHAQIIPVHLQEIITRLPFNLKTKKWMTVSKQFKMLSPVKGFDCNVEETTFLCRWLIQTLDVAPVNILERHLHRKSKKRRKQPHAVQRSTFTRLPVTSETFSTLTLSSFSVTFSVVVANTLLSTVWPKPSFWTSLGTDWTLNSRMEKSLSTQKNKKDKWI